MGIIGSKPDPNQEVIIVVGPTGAGKSFLINTVVGREELKVGRSLEPCTTAVQSVRCRNEISNRKVTFIDTPALQQDDVLHIGALDELEKGLKAWMSKARVQQATGILYLHRISDNRITAPSASTMAAFGRLLRSDVSSRIILVTTMWDRTKLEVGEFRENQIKGSYWQNTLNAGSQVVRFDKTAESVWKAVDLIRGVR